MAGHSKWANIQHRKKAQDAKRGKLFTRLIREVSIAVKQGGGPDPGGTSWTWPAASMRVATV